MELGGRGTRISLVTAEAAVLARVQAVTATLGVEPDVLTEPAALRASWAQASLVLVGVDLASAVAELVLPARRGVYLVGLDEGLADVCAWSVPLAAAVLSLPSGAEALASVLGELAGRRPGAGRLLALVGGAGGVGSSTCAAGLAMVAARLGRRTALVDLDEQGGGLDLLVGAERTEGWRWPRLGGARGFLGDLHGLLPHVDGVDVLSTARPATPGPALQTEPVRAVLLSALRTHDVVVADLPRTLTPAAREALRQADEVLLVVRSDLRGIAAARQLLPDLLPACAAPRVLARHGRFRGVDADAVAVALTLPGSGVVPHDASLPLAAERGEPPARSARSPLGRSCRRVLERLGALEGAA